MPKLKEKTLTATLYTYVRPVNNLWVRRQAKKQGLSYSEYVDRMISRARGGAHSHSKVSKSKAA